MLDVKSQDISIPDTVVVLCTAPDEATAQDLAAKVLAEKLAACVTLLPGATSLYYWEGKLEQEYEVQMILKTTVTHQQALLDCLKSYPGTCPTSHGKILRRAFGTHKNFCCH